MTAQANALLIARGSALLVALSFVGFIALGLPDAVIGVAWPALQAYFRVPVDALGPLFITTTTGSVIASTATGAILRRFHVGHLLAASCLVTALSLLGYVFAPAWSVFVLIGLFAGLGAGAIDAAINTHAAVRYTPRLVNVLHAFYGLGAAAGPAVMTAMLTSGRGWQSGYAVIVAVEAALATAFFLTRSRWPDVAQNSEHHRGVSLLQTLRLKRVRLSLLVFFLYTGCEAAAGAWTFSLLFKGREVAMATAGTAVTLYWGGLFASRLGYAFLPSTTSPVRVIRACMWTALIATVTLLLNLGSWIDVVAVTIMGFAFGPIFPSLIATTPARVGAEHVANTVGLQISVAAIGLAALPSVCGLVAADIGLGAIPMTLAICWAVLTAAYFLLDRGR